MILFVHGDWFIVLNSMMSDVLDYATWFIVLDFFNELVGVDLLCLKIKNYLDGW